MIFDAVGKYSIILNLAVLFNWSSFYIKNSKELTGKNKKTNTTVWAWLHLEHKAAGKLCGLGPGPLSSCSQLGSPDRRVNWADHCDTHLPLALQWTIPTSMLFLASSQGSKVGPLYRGPYPGLRLGQWSVASLQGPASPLELWAAAELHRSVLLSLEVLRAMVHGWTRTHCLKGAWPGAPLVRSISSQGRNKGGWVQDVKEVRREESQSKWNAPALDGGGNQPIPKEEDRVEPGWSFIKGEQNSYPEGDNSWSVCVREELLQREGGRQRWDNLPFWGLKDPQSHPNHSSRRYALGKADGLDNNQLLILI